ncbi:protein-glutamate methylesterase/protein-glutamine glutaminase [Spirochaeta lutea]|uniref:Protein-glutamate methylesterase/protein-glutamine glutaminase n=1 Tax=Spirochaeta lutea TaxID=1480694 RepID=A0A098R548_9SPIO|nr:chemotaxis response regulator protein-glutamate methylesterase [Spirochaeta lutea]KGE73847.1 chemotaxis protein CheY [Spirochaeta lutea]
MIRVLIVDDSAVVRETLRELLDAEPDIEVVATAADPVVAAKKLESIIPDVITLDIEMPRLDGITFLKALMSQHPLPVVICSSKAEGGSNNALRALELGAVDIIEKPKVGTKIFLEEARTRIADTIRAAAKAKTAITGKPVASLPRMEVKPKLTADAVLERGRRSQAIETTEKLCVVGASTGGTEALREFLEAMPLDCPGIVIVQHMPEKFTAAFAQRLNSLCTITVQEAKTNDPVLRGTALIAPGNRHCLLRRQGARYFVEIKDGPLVSRHRPSVDVLFRSAANYAGKNCIGVIMTGMGDDGARGMEELKSAGAFTIAQDEESSVVFGMPKEAIKRGVIDRILPLDKIPQGVLEAVHTIS